MAPLEERKRGTLGSGQSKRSADHRIRFAFQWREEFLSLFVQRLFIAKKLGRRVCRCFGDRAFKRGLRGLRKEFGKAAILRRLRHRIQKQPLLNLLQRLLVEREESHSGASGGIRPGDLPNQAQMLAVKFQVQRQGSLKLQRDGCFNPNAVLR